MLHGMHRRLSVTVLYLAAYAFVAHRGEAQEFRGQISGIVTDPSGAPVAGAKVTALNLDRRVPYEATTNEAGLYLTRFLPPGDYDLSIEKEGFKKAIRQKLIVSAADRLNLDIRLEIGALAESVSVTSESPLLETETASRRSNIEQKFIQDIPASGRNLYQFLFLLPGVTKTSRYWGNFELYAFGNMNAISINGGRSGENETLIDGITSTRGSRSTSFAPALNAIEEVSVQTNSYDSQYGRFGGGVTSVTLKTGTNQLHGQLFEFFKNDNLASNGYSRNAAGLRRPEYKNNTFGFTVDGPIFIPKVFDGRNKMFFMIAFEGLRERNPQDQIWNVPTAAERRGDFSSLGNVALFDPLTTRQEGNALVRTPFPGNQIPGARINPVAARAISFYPEPNRGRELDGVSNYIRVASSRNFYDQWLGKLDWNLSSRHRVSGRYGQTPWFNFARVQWGTNAAEPSGEYPSTRISRNWGYDWTWTVSPSMVFNLRAGLARYEGFSGNEFGRDFDPRQLGFPDRLVSQFVALQYPRFNPVGNNYSPLGATQTSGYETQDTYSIQPNMQVVRGRQNWKFGAEIRRYNDNRIRPASAAGNYTFNRNWTQRDPLRADALSGDSMATFLLGLPTSGFVDRNMDPAYRNNYWSFFFQDDWKLTRKLTLNLGMRWDYEAPITERFNRQIRGFAFNETNPLQSQVQGLNLRGGLLFAGDSGAARYAFNRDRNNFQPRIGVAWQPIENWVIRGGYGLYYLGQNAAGPDSGFSAQTNLVSSLDGGLTPAVTLSDPFPASLFPTGLLQPIGSSQGLRTFLGQGISAQFLDRPLPYSQQFSFGFQRTLFRQWLIDASYVGNLTSKLPVGMGQNFIPAEELNRLPVDQRAAFFNAQVANPLRGLLPGSALNGATVPRQNLLVAFPHFSGVGISNVPVGSQSFHSLQMKGTKRYSNGFALQMAYTWGKTLEQVALLNAQDVVLGSLTQSQAERRLVEFDIPHTFSFMGVYELPVGKGKRFLGGANRLANAVIGGWNLNAQYIWRSGQPIEFPNAAPTAARSAKLSDSQRDALAAQAGRPDKTFNPFFDKWFDTTLFPRQAQAPFTLRTFPTRFPDVRSPELTSWEISVYKEFKFWERTRFQLRADMQNAFDRPYFGRVVSPNVQDPRFGQLNPAQDNAPRIVVIVAKILF